MLASEASESERESVLFRFDNKYDHFRWFRLTRVTAYCMNVFK